MYNLPSLCLSVYSYWLCDLTFSISINDHSLSQVGDKLLQLTRLRWSLNIILNTLSGAELLCFIDLTILVTVLIVDLNSRFIVHCPEETTKCNQVFNHSVKVIYIVTVFITDIE